MARQLAPLILSDEERAELEALAGRRKTARALALNYPSARRAADTPIAASA
jgi:hypothetical protein